VFGAPSWQEKALACGSLVTRKCTSIALPDSYCHHRYCNRFTNSSRSPSWLETSRHPSTNSAGARAAGSAPGFYQPLSSRLHKSHASIISLSRSDYRFRSATTPLEEDSHCNGCVRSVKQTAYALGADRSRQRPIWPASGFELNGT
jgi:hypothetical protein